MTLETERRVEEMEQKMAALDVEMNILRGIGAANMRLQEALYPFASLCGFVESFIENKAKISPFPMDGGIRLSDLRRARAAFADAGPDLIEEERAACEAIARDYARWGDHGAHASVPAREIADAIAARRRK